MKLHTRVALIAAPAMLVAACGSQLSESQVLARSQHTVAVQPGSSGATGQTSQPATVAPGVGAGAATPASIGGGTVASSGGRKHGGAVSVGSTSTTGSVATGSTGAAVAPTANAAAAASTACHTTATGPIVIGNVGSYSGAGGSSLGGFPVAVQMWAAMVNRQGGICGRPVQVVVRDDGGDPATYGSDVRSLVQQNHVVAFVGNGATLSYAGGASYLAQNRIPVIGSDCGYTWYGASSFAPECPTFPDALKGMVQAGVQLTHHTKLGVVFCAESPVCKTADDGLKNGAAAAGGAKLVYNQSVSITQVDFTAECEAARSAGVQLMVVGADVDTTSRFAQSCAAQGWYPQYLGIGVTLNGDTISGAGLHNMIIEQDVFPFAGASGGAIDEYNQVVKAYGASPSPALSMGWASAKLFGLIATRAAQSSKAITPQTIVAAMHTVKNETLGGLTVPLTYTAQGAKPAHCWFVMEGDGTGHGYKLPYGSKPRCG